MPVFSLPVLGEPTRMISSKDLLGRPYLMNVWGSWCPTCRDEQPQLTALSRSGKIRVIGYNYKDAPEDAQSWLKQFGNPFEFIIADEDGRVALDWGVYGAPESFLVDGHGHRPLEADRTDHRRGHQRTNRAATGGHGEGTVKRVALALLLAAIGAFASAQPIQYRDCGRGSAFSRADRRTALRDVPEPVAGRLQRADRP